MTRVAFAKAARALGGKYSDPGYVALAAKAQGIKTGMTMDEVRGILGSPTYVQGWRTKDGYDFDQCARNYVRTGDVKKDYFLEDDWFEVDFGPDQRVRIEPLIK